ncbi:hypothetical protein E2320_013069 [Naja naja]|nr:hypothetical protein E2320_013069 [Naja naja]
MLIRVNMEDLREQTHTRHYELYRRCKLEEMGFKDTDPDSKPFSLQETYEAKRNEFLGELQKKEEEMRQMFVQRVKEKEAELKEAEKRLFKRQMCSNPRYRFLIQEILPLTCNPFTKQAKDLPLSIGIDLCALAPLFQLHEKFDRLKKLHQDEKKKLEDKKKSLDDEVNAFKQRKSAAELLQSQTQQAGGSQTLKREKERKNEVKAVIPGYVLSSSPLNILSWDADLHLFIGLPVHLMGLPECHFILYAKSLHDLYLLFRLHRGARLMSKTDITAFLVHCEDNYLNERRDIPILLGKGGADQNKKKFILGEKKKEIWVCFSPTPIFPRLRDLVLCETRWKNKGGKGETFFYSLPPPKYCSPMNEGGKTEASLKVARENKSPFVMNSCDRTAALDIYIYIYIYMIHVSEPALLNLIPF